MKLKVTNTKTGKVWIEENTNHSWQDLCLDIMKEHKEEHKDFYLVYCDLEGILKLNDIWYMLDECGNWEYMPEEYKIEEIEESNEIDVNKGSTLPLDMD